MTKKLKDSIHELLYLCFNTDNSENVVNSFLEENIIELSDKETWDYVYDKINSNFIRHNSLTNSHVTFGDHEGLYLKICCKKAEKYSQY